MTIAPGTRLGPYEIVEHLGAGGMGEVYKAHDTRLGRNVAIKVLSARLAGDEALKKRFLREARAISALNHPHICGLYDIGHDDGHEFLVMEYLEGETLAERLARGALPSEEALRYAIEIADALERAHKQGIIHRDLKPGNIMLTKSGAKLLDFGLARFAEAESSATGPLTADDAMIGTVDYMSPEHLRGDPLDTRVDIFSFGVVLYEMLTGTRPFTGHNRASVIGAILFSMPEPLTARKSEVPAGFEPLISACLQKDAEERIHTAHDLRLQLEWLRAGGIESARPRGRAKWKWLSAISPIWMMIAVLGVVATAVMAPRLRQHEERQISFTLQPPTASEEIEWPVISPDGNKIVFISVSVDGKRSLWIRDLASATPRQLLGTDGAMQPFWSPDSSAVAFFGVSKLLMLPLSGTVPQPIATALAPRGASWGRGNAIIVAPHISSGLWLTSSVGSTPRPITQLDPSQGDVTHRWPEFLPDGERFLFVIRSRRLDRSGLYLGKLGTPNVKKISAIQSRTIVTPSGWMLYMKDGQLYRQRFNLKRAEAAGQPILVAPNVGVDLKVTGASAMSVSRDGTLTYLTKPDARTELVWVDRAGKPLSRLAPSDYYVNPSLSPDGRTLAVSRIDPNSGRNSLWLIDAGIGKMTPFVVDDTNADGPVWSATGGDIYYQSDRRGSYEVYVKEVGGIGAERLIYPSKTYAQVTSARSSAILMHEASPTGEGTVLLWPAGSPKPRPISSGTRAHNDLSPDGKWIAGVRMGQDSTTFEIFIESVQDPRRKLQISDGGGSQPIWRADGEELYYVNFDRQLIAVPFRSGEPQPAVPLFPTTIENIFYSAHDYAPSLDGTRFLINRRVATNEVATATVVTNWEAAAR